MKVKNVIAPEKKYVIKNIKTDEIICELSNEKCIKININKVTKNNKIWIGIKEKASSKCNDLNMHYYNGWIIEEI
jgi:hypothetical protein